MPAHPDLAASRIDADLVADCLGAWAAAWDAPYVVVDTHPGANALTDGAMQIADLVVVPVVLGAREMDALEAIVADLAGYRLLLAPTMVPPVPPKRFVERLAGHPPQAAGAQLRVQHDPAEPERARGPRRVAAVLRRTQALPPRQRPPEAPPPPKTGGRAGPPRRPPGPTPPQPATTCRP